MKTPKIKLPKLPKSKRPRLLLIVGFVVIAAISAGAGWYWQSNRDQPETTVKLDSAAKARVAEGKKRNRDQLDAELAKLGTKDISDTQKANAYANAALMAAGLDLPEAKDYAQKALDLMEKVKDPNVKPIGDPLTPKLQKIAQGNYAK